MRNVWQSVGIVLCLHSAFHGTLLAHSEIGLIQNTLNDRILETLVPEEAVTFTARLKKYAHDYIGKPYVLNPLGEGAGVDKDPRFRDDAFDCVTYVETMLALSYGEKLHGPWLLMDAIRYFNGESSYANRRHYTESQWMDGLVKDGLLIPITSKIALQSLVSVKTELFHFSETRARAKQPRGSPKLLWNEKPIGVETLVEYIALAEIPRVMHAVPEGAIFFVVKEDDGLRPTRISHLGFVFQNEVGVPYLVHASSGKKKRVIQESIPVFLARQKNARWKTVGLSFMIPVPKKLPF